MTAWALRGVALAAAWIGIAAAADDPLRTLRQGGALSCRSPEPFFCENVHVRCAGRTAVPTFPFELRSAAGSVALVSEAAEFQRRYENADVQWDQDGTNVLLRPKGAPGRSVDSRVARR